MFLILLHLIQMLKNSGNITLTEHNSLLMYSEKNFFFLSGILHLLVTLFVIQGCCSWATINQHLFYLY